MPYTVELQSGAQRDFRSLDLSISVRISKAVDALELNPRPPGCIKLTGEAHPYRVRVGAYRIVYEINDELSLVSVDRIQHRREVYRR